MPISVRIRLSHTNEKLDNKTNNKIRQVEIMAISSVVMNVPTFI